MAKTRKVRPATFTKYKLVIDEYFENNFQKAKAYNAIFKESTTDIGAINNMNGILEIPEIQEYISFKQRLMEQKTGITHDHITQDLLEIKTRCMQGEPFRTKDGVATGVYKFDSGGALKALELIGKHVGYFGVDNDQKAEKSINVIQWVE